MSGAQPKAARIAGAVSVIAEVDVSRIATRHQQGWVDVVVKDLDEALALADQARGNRENLSIAFHGNIVDLLEHMARVNFKVDLLSDQTSCMWPMTGAIARWGSRLMSVRSCWQKTGKHSGSWWIKASTGTLLLCSKLSEQGAYFF